MRTCKKIIALFSLLVSVGLAPANAGAAPVYMGVSVGGNVSTDVTVTSNSDDRASICDEYINPRALAVPECASPDRGAGDGWLAPFDGGWGVSLEAELGYRLSPRYRVAGIYAYNETNFNQTVSSTDATGVDFDKISNELSVGEETLGGARTHELFLVAFRDWPNRTRWTPYAGIGAGVSWAHKDFSWRWARSADPQDIETGLDQPNTEEIRSNLAGTESTGRAALRDVMVGYVFMAGVDRAVTKDLSMGLKLQWKGFDTFESDLYQGDLLRSHSPNLRLDGSEPVSAWSGTNDTDRFSIMFTMRYALP
ncbi:MAG: hypothetical protein OXN26_11645 [Gammaproteobacteria bacterium]|nr:hypothetical protein [Gammaproteobacteria bacterium]